MRKDLPEFVRCAERLLAEVETAVKRFTRYNRYGYGMRLSARAMELVSLGNRTWRDQARQRELAQQLIFDVDDFQAQLRLGKEIRAFASFPEFEQIVRTAEELGRQLGGWKKQMHLKSQNPAPQVIASPERAQTLSARAASTFEAHP